MAGRGQNHGKGKNKLAYAPKPKIPPPPKSEDPKKDSICHECGETGHCKRNCPQYLAELLKKKKNAASGADGSGIFVIELNTILNRSWIYDTGCGNGQREAVEAIGIFYLCLPSRLEIVLNNCHYAPSITKRKKRIEKLQHDGLLNSTDLRAFEQMCLFRYGYVYLLKHKHEVFKTFKVFQKEVVNQLSKTIISLRSDRVGDYMSQEFLDHLKDHRIIAHRTPPYTPQHNGVSKRRNRTLLDMVEKTPYKVWHGQVPKATYLKVWGCEALVKRDTLTKPDKLELKSIKCIFIGYPKKTIGYSFYYLPENKVLVARNAEFLENSLITQEASGSLEDLEIIQGEDKHPSIDASLNHKEDDLEIDEPQSDIIPIHRSTRTRHPTDRMCLYIDAEEHELEDLGEPANYKAALLNPKSDKWLNAMNVEMQSMEDNEVWVLVKLPPNGKTVGSKWLFKKKTNMDGVVHTYTTRLVVKGYTQTSGIDYEKIFSSVTDIRAIRILIAIVAYYDYEIWQMDVKTAFLNGYLNEEVYMEQPEGFVNPKYPNRVCKLKHSIYGLKQASRQWNK
nr:hypothetical protein [Tanacetum cinerariifolium]